MKNSMSDTLAMILDICVKPVRRDGSPPKETQIRQLIKERHPSIAKAQSKKRIQSA